MSNKRKEFNLMGKRFEFNPSYVTPQLIDESIFPSINSIALDISGRCNLSCIYCAESVTMPIRRPMSRSVLKSSIDFLFNWSAKGSGVSIHLGSGEPLLEPNAVLEIGRLAKHYADVENRLLEVNLTTNGTLFNLDIVDQLIVDDWNIKISLDGDSEIHDKYRISKDGQGTYQVVSRWVKELSARIPSHFSTTSVLCHGNDPVRVFESISKLGVKKIEIVPVAAPRNSSLLLQESDLTKYRRFILDYVKSIAAGEHQAINIGFQSRVKKVLGYGNRCVPCGAGRRFFAVGSTGVFYPCFRFIGLERYIMGNIEDGISPKAVEQFVKTIGRSSNDRIYCRECWAFSLCGGPCFACVEFFGPEEPSWAYCEMVKIESMAAVWLAESLRDDNPQRLLEYIGVSFE